MHPTGTATPDSTKRDFPGLFIVDSPGKGGISGFQWFTHDADALEYLRALPASYGLEANAAFHARCAIAIALDEVTRLGSVDLDALNAALKGLCEVRWAGTLDDLRNGGDAFARKVQVGYDRHISTDTQGHPDEDLAAFLHYLGTAQLAPWSAPPLLANTDTPSARQAGISQTVGAVSE